MTPRAALDHGLQELRLPAAEGAADKLMAYLALLAKWNKTYNLTAVRDPLAAVSHHLLDSLAVFNVLAAERGTLVDIGSGGGLPGIPLAIMDPSRVVVLNDANEKKGAFLKQAVIELGLRNASVHVGRVEDWRPVERFAIAIARGFVSVAEFLATSRHLVAPRGLIAAMKGIYPAAELAAAPVDCDCSDVRVLSVPLLSAERHLVLCRCGNR
jgi:16S rRNA (guanine527-N7)-methyltransferase